MLLDVHLPRLSGLELTGLLARLDVHVPIVFITADQELAESTEMRRTGRPCLLKPIDDDALVRAISAAAAEYQRAPVTPPAPVPPPPSSTASSTGLTRKSLAPALVARSAIATSPCPVMKTTGRPGHRVLKLLEQIEPETSGIRTSISAHAGAVARQMRPGTPRPTRSSPPGSPRP